MPPKTEDFFSSFNLLTVEALILENRNGPHWSKPDHLWSDEVLVFQQSTKATDGLSVY